jgi:NADH:ubiquinone oxidoreductase subunit 3 (subunit A)
MKYDIIYYLIGILYLIFDLEIVLLYPIIYVLKSYLSILILFLFITILILGYIYEWHIGALDIL